MYKFLVEHEPIMNEDQEMCDLSQLYIYNFVQFRNIIYNYCGVKNWVNNKNFWEKHFLLLNKI